MAPCTLCEQPQVDTAYACPDCADRTRRDLEWLAANAAELDVTVARLSRTRATGSDRPSTPARTIPINISASHDRDAVQNTISTWARDILEHRPHLHPPAGTIGGCAAWISGQLDWIRHRPYAAAALDELSDAAALARRIVDSPPARVYRGPCHSVTATGPCTQELYAPDGAETIRCQSCGTEHDSRSRRDWLLRQASDHLAPAAAIATAIRAWTPYRLDSSTVRQWVRRGRLVARGRSGDGRPTYPVRDAIALAEAAASRQRQRRTD